MSQLSGQFVSERKKNHTTSLPCGACLVGCALVWDFYYPRDRQAVGAAGPLRRALESVRSVEGAERMEPPCKTRCPPPLRLGHRQTPQSPVPTKPFNLGELGLSFLPAPNILYFITDGQAGQPAEGGAWVCTSRGPLDLLPATSTGPTGRPCQGPSALRMQMINAIIVKHASVHRSPRLPEPVSSRRHCQAEIPSPAFCRCPGGE